MPRNTAPESAPLTEPAPDPAEISTIRNFVSVVLPEASAWGNALQISEDYSRENAVQGGVYCAVLCGLLEAALGHLGAAEAQAARVAALATEWFAEAERMATDPKSDMRIAAAFDRCASDLRAALGGDGTAATGDLEEEIRDGDIH